jgi:diguanylate cyclase (GGDEF)-like protein/PAS domain S-box-containing protein
MLDLRLNDIYELNAFEEVKKRWQRLTNSLTRIINVPTALIFEVTPPHSKVFCSSKVDDNPYQEGDRISLKGSYCEHIINQDKKLLVTDARKDENWKQNPAVELGMVSYLGFPIKWPHGEVFGTICVLDNKENNYNEIYEKTIFEFKKIIEADLADISSKPKEFEHKEVEELLLSSEDYEILLAAMNASIDGMAVLNRDKKFIYLNKAHAEIYGYETKEELLGKSWEVLYSNKEIEKIRKEVFSKLDTTGKWRGELIGKRKDGQTFPQEVSLTEIEKGGLICVVRDIIERKQTEDKIKELNFHDEVTDLYNRAYFEEELRRLDTERQLPLSLIVGDMNGLKLVNDAFGHSRGDKRLRKMAGVLKRCCREEDIVARWGGDEFIIILPQTGLTVADGVCKRIERLCEDTRDGEIKLSIALGTAAKTKPEQDVHEVFEKAEDRMYKNKLMNSSKARANIISSLEDSLIEKDYEIEGHIKRLKDLALKFGQKLGLSSGTLDKVALLAAFHDIGKVAIAEGIITKSSKLSKEEWGEVKKHPEIGYRIAQASDKLTPIAEAILSHHEWWDGTGYPQKKEGKEIPLISRIISIIDAYDVMTHGRSYKVAISNEEAITELKRCAGVQFDPYLTEKFIDLISKKEDY